MFHLKTPLIILVFLTFANSAKILGIFPSPGYSQFILAESLMGALAEKGHEVTVISPFAPKNPPKNYRTVSSSGSLKVIDIDMADSSFEFQNPNVYFSLIVFYLLFGVPMTEYTLVDTEVQELINSNATFDLVIAEQFATEALYGFASHFKTPLVIFSSLGPCEWTYDLVGNPAIPSYVPHSFIGYTADMNFLQRINNIAVTAFDSLLKELVVYPAQNKLLQKYFPNSPKLEKIMYNASIVLLNSHEAIWEPVPLLPNMIEIGGFHVAPEPLPVELRKFLDEASDGVVLFSMGSNLKSTDLPVDTRNHILEVFSKLKQNVLWKFEDEDIVGLPKNVRIAKWFPQRAVLAHPNTKAFISHCGFISTVESVFYGVPRICIPILGDQLMNSAFMEKYKIGIRLDLEDLNKDNLGDALDKLLNDKRYAYNAKERSRAMQDTPVKPLDLAIFWIEYVIRHRGAPHFRSAALDLPFYKRWMLDVLTFVIAVAVLLFKISCIVIRRIGGSSIKRIDKAKKIK